MGLYQASDIANYFIAFSHEHGDPITNLKLQKLLYYAQAWFLAIYDAPLFGEDIEAWVHGPVVPEVYRRFKLQAWRPIQDDIQYPSLERWVTEHLDEVMEKYGVMTAYELERLTHQETPWIKARGGIASDEASHAVISQGDMKSYYRAWLNG